MANARTPKTVDVFLSHGSHDKPWVRTLHDALTKRGVTAYLDQAAIVPGDNFVCNLSSGIGRTSTFVIVVSQGTMDRPWVELEWTSFVATHGPRNRIIPVLLDHVELPAFLRPFQAIHAVDRDAEVVAERIARSVATGSITGNANLQSGRTLIFTVTPIEGSKALSVTSVDGVARTVTPPWQKGNEFGIALWDFEKLTREPATSDRARTDVVQAAQTVGAGLFELLFSNEGSLANFQNATAAGARAVLTLRSDEDTLLSLPWELLYHADCFLVRDGVLDVVRSTTGAVQFETQLAPPSEPFTIVTNVSAPEGSALSYEAESFRVTHALTNHCPQTPTELGTLADLVQTVAREKPRGIHFSGHGAPGVLVFENDEGFEEKVPIDRVVTELRRGCDGSLPPFFFLASCHGNTPARPTEGKSGSTSTAAELHRAGVTEVVGYYGPIADELSTRAEEALYAAIAEGEPTRIAVAKARAAVLRAFDGDSAHRPQSGAATEPSRLRDAGTTANTTHPFAWAQLVFYRRGPEHALGTRASQEKLRQRDAALKRSYRNLTERAFLKTGFIGRRRELHELRRRRRRGDRVLVLQGLGGLGKTTLAGQLLPTLADEASTIAIWCRRTEDEDDPAEALVAQLLAYGRARFGSRFEEFVSYVDRKASENAVQRFATLLQILLAQQQEREPLVVYLDNLESLLHGPKEVSLDKEPDPHAFGTWRSSELREIWRGLTELSRAAENLFVVASCRYRNDDLASHLLAVSPLADVDLYRLMAWFPALRRLSTRSRARLAHRLSGHPRAVEFMDDLVAASIRSWEETNGELKAPSSSDAAALDGEWERLVAPLLPVTERRIWSDLLLAILWERVLDERSRRMLFRMTLLRRPWDDGLSAHLGEADEDSNTAQRTAQALTGTSLLEQIDVVVQVATGYTRRRRYTVHPSTAAFVRGRFADATDLAVASHRRIGEYLEAVACKSPELSDELEAGHHLFAAGEYDRAYELLGSASDLLRNWGRVRESMQILLPFLHDEVQRSMERDRVGRLLGTVGLAYHYLGETRLALEHFEQALVIAREIGDRRGEGRSLGNLGNACSDLGETHRAIELYEQRLVIAREIGDRRGEGAALGNLGTAYARLGETRGAIEHYEQRLVIAREIGDHRGEGSALGNLGSSYLQLGETRRAIEHHEKALDIMRKIGDRRGEGSALGSLGNAYFRLGETHRAIEHYEQHLVIAREIGNRRGEGSDLGNLGNVYAVLGDTRRAIEHYEQALAIGRAISDPVIIRTCENGLRSCRGDASS